MAKTRRSYEGGALSTTTTSAIAASGTTSFTITAYTGWPYGADPFYVVVEPGTASEEKILVTRTGSTDTTINVASDDERGQDGTSAVSHASGSTVFPVFTAVDADEANELTSSWSAKGDLVSHGSTTFETLAVGTNDEVLTADSSTASGLAWKDTLSVASASVSGDLTVDTSTLHVDSTNNRVGIRTTTPSYALDVDGDINATGDLRVAGNPVGMVLVKTQTIGSGVSSVTVTNAFSATFQNYRIAITLNVTSAQLGLCFQFGTTNTAYYGNMSYAQHSDSAYTLVPQTNQPHLFIGLTDTSNPPGCASSFDVHSPQLATRSDIHGTFFGRGYTGQFGGVLANTTQYTSFTIFNASGTLTGGTIRVYGYNNG